MHPVCVSSLSTPSRVCSTSHRRAARPVVVVRAEKGDKTRTGYVDEDNTGVDIVLFLLCVFCLLNMIIY